MDVKSGNENSDGNDNGSESKKQLLVERVASIMIRLSYAPELLFAVCYHLPRSHIPEVIMNDTCFHKQWSKWHVTVVEKELMKNRINRTSKVRYDRKVVMTYEDGELVNRTFFIGNYIECIYKYFDHCKRMIKYKYYINPNYSNTVETMQQYVKLGDNEVGRHDRFNDHNHRTLRNPDNTRNHHKENYILDGECKSYHRDNMLRGMCTYKRGVVYGIERCFDVTCKCISKLVYDNNGKLLTSTVLNGRKCITRTHTN